MNLKEPSLLYLLAHRPWWEKTEWDHVFDLGLILQFNIQMWMFLMKVVHEVAHEVVDDICLVAFSHCVKVNSSPWESES